MAIYTFSVDAVALAAATAKTIIELGAAATGARPRIIEWWVEFDGVSSAAVPVKCEIGRFSATVTTATTGTPSDFDPTDTALSVVRHTATVEGAGTVEAGTPIHRVSPTSGLYVQMPLGREMLLNNSTFWRIRLTAAAVVNATCGVTWEE